MCLGGVCASSGALGLLGRVTDLACLFEPFHEAPSIEDVIECVRKLLNHRHARALKHTRAAERTWLLCGGRPDEALAAPRAQSMPGWPRGFYELSSQLGLSLVVLSELPDDDDTLALRRGLERVRPLRHCGTGGPRRATRRGEAHGGRHARCH